MLNKKEKVMMELIFSKANETGDCLLTPLEILKGIPLDLDFRENDIEETMKALKADLYFSYDHVYKNDELIYAIVLREKGLSFKRDQKHRRKKLIERLVLAVVVALLGVAVRLIVQAIFKK